MSKQLESKTCQFCHGILFEDDDVVVCPECAAPYHRACYEQCGKCVLEEFHGTDDQYDILQKRKEEDCEKTETEQKQESETVCSVCGKRSSSEHGFCPHCGAAKASRQNRFSPYATIRFDSLGGVDKNADIGDGVTAGEAATFVGMKAYRYIPRFIQNKKFSWNWAAFLVPQGWFAYRKMYGIMALTLTAFVLSAIFMVPFYSHLFAAIGDLPIASTNAEHTLLMQQAMLTAMQNAEPSSLLLFFIGSVVEFATMVLSGLFGERAYRSKVIETIKKLKDTAQGEDLDMKIAHKGGVNLFLCFFILLLVSNSDYIIELLISLF